MKNYLFFLAVLTGPSLVAQTISGDSILANERSIDRPVTVHGGQLRITGGYGLSIISKRFDTEGEVIRLRDEGLSSVRHRLMLDIKYGIHEYIQFNAAIAQSGNVLREQTRYIFPNEPDPVVMQEVLKEYSGLEDLFLGIDLRAPFSTRKLDLAVTLGAHLPVAPFEPKRPDHSFEFTEDGGSAMNKFMYRYYYPLGKGVTIAKLGGIIKYRTSQWAFSTRLDYQHGLKDGQSFEWRHQLNDDVFEYRKDPFRYRLPDAFTYFAEAEYQPLPWFDIILNVSGYQSSDGWTAPEEDLKLALPEQSYMAISPGFEIIVTPKLWLREQMNFSLSGKSYEAPFAFQTSVIYNFFPF